MSQFEGKKILLGVTGSIAAYKAAELVSKLVKRGAEVRVVMTREAAQFITPLTLRTLSRNPVALDPWEEPRDWKPEHIALADFSDLFLVAPATAHILACFAHGLAPDLLTTTYLANRAPVLLAPAMNEKMFEHPATQANLATLRARGHTVVEPTEGALACGVSGRGRLATLDEILCRAALLLDCGGGSGAKACGSASA